MTGTRNSTGTAASQIRLQPKITCPNCWHQFAVEDTLWIAEHADLIGDPVLGPDRRQRFLPSRFDALGNALDVRGFPCHRVACARCHLEIPRALLELKPTFISVLGAPSSGKSCLLTSMIWQLRHSFPSYFNMTFADADVELNAVLNEYERLQFMSMEPDRIVAIRKTETEGQQYESVKIGEQTISYLRPYIFTLRPSPGHPNYHASQQISTAVCIYDNAGEHFLPGQDATHSPVTRHLVRSEFIMFLFDPTQDPGFRAACAQHSSDPQFNRTQRVTRQESILLEAANRIRIHAGLSYQQKLDRPVLVLVTKYDAWGDFFENRHSLTTPWLKPTTNYPARLDCEMVERWSDHIRAILLRLCPQIVSLAEDLSEKVTYLPVSAFGHCAEMDGQMVGVRPQHIKPIWADVPLPYALARWKRGIIPKL